MVEGKGWFQIGGEHTGHVPLERQIAGIRHWLRPIDQPCYTLLDLGCAEGLIANWAVQAGYCDVAVGIEGDARKINRARETRAAPGVHMIHGNFNETPITKILSDNKFTSTFEVVLALAIAHKLKDPLSFLNEAASIAQRRMIVRLPFGHELCEKMQIGDLDLLVSFSGYPGFEDFDKSQAWTGLYLRR